jgi:hypothetical protein
VRLAEGLLISRVLVLEMVADDEKLVTRGTIAKPNGYFIFVAAAYLEVAVRSALHDDKFFSFLVVMWRVDDKLNLRKIPIGDG